MQLTQQVMAYLTDARSHHTGADTAVTLQKISDELMAEFPQCICYASGEIATMVSHGFKFAEAISNYIGVCGDIPVDNYSSGQFQEDLSDGFEISGSSGNAEDADFPWLKPEANAHLPNGYEPQDPATGRIVLPRESIVVDHPGDVYRPHYGRCWIPGDFHNSYKVQDSRPRKSQDWYNWDDGMRLMRGTTAVPASSEDPYASREVSKYSNIGACEPAHNPAPGTILPPPWI